MSRRIEGRETWHRLLEWDKGQASAERLALLILCSEGYKSIDPSHPLGGRDGLKDMIISSSGLKWIGGVYFPRGQQVFNDIKDKFKSDLEGVKKNNAAGFAFITNQELRLAERKELCDIDITIDIQIYHLERITSILNRPENYGIRLDFLDIDMTREEQLAYFAVYDKKMSDIENILAKLSVGLDNFKTVHQLEEYDGHPRCIEEISEAEEEFFDKIWFDRHMWLKRLVEKGKEEVDPEIWKGALIAEKDVIEKYGESNLGPYNDYEWGMINGKLSAIRWVLGCEWDMLDT